MQTQKVFFLHIPKTAGNSINAYFKKTVDALQYHDHLESNAAWRDATQRQQLIEGGVYLSGHITYAELTKKLDHNDWFVFTCLREPHVQLVSHFAYVRNLAEPSERKRFDVHTPVIQELALRLAEIDLSNPGSLERLPEALGPHGVALFHNTQTRYLGGRPGTNPVTEKDLEVALENAAQLDFVALNEAIDDDLKAIAQYLGVERVPEIVPKENVATNKFGLDPRNETQMRSLRPLIEYDVRLYQAVKASRQGFQYKALRRHIVNRASGLC